MTAAPTRRHFLAGAGVALAATACTGGGGDAGERRESPDVATAARAAGLEQLTVDTYTTLRARAVEGRLGAVIPPAVTEFVTTAIGRHQEHLDAWSRVLVAPGREEATAADIALTPRVEAALSRLVDIPGLITLALRMEDHTAQTYLQALPTLTDAAVIRTAAQILVVDQQHQSLLRYLLGLYPVGNGTVRDTTDFAPADPRAALARW